MGRRAAPGRQQRAWAVGVDLGGTWLRVLAEDVAGRRRSHREPAPPVDALASRLQALWRRWRVSPGGVDALVVASRGIWTPVERRRMARDLRDLARRVHVMADVEAAHLGALGRLPGVLLLAGTGSIAVARDGLGRIARAGGLGPLIGDEGSAFWIGREWLKRSARVGAVRAPGRRGAGGMASVARGAAGRSDPDARRVPLALRARRLARSPDAVARIAAMAPGVIRRAQQGSPRARAIVREAQAHLAALLADAASSLGLRPPIAVSWAGGLLARRAFREGVWRQSRVASLGVTPIAPRTGAVAAALRAARERIP